MSNELFNPDWNAMAVMVSEQKRIAKELEVTNNRLHELAVYCAGLETKLALAEQPAQQQEPVAWKDRTYGNLHHQDFGNSIPLYTSPPASKPWVGLTQEDRVEIWKKSASIDGAINATASKLQEKNA